MRHAVVPHHHRGVHVQGFIRCYVSPDIKNSSQVHVEAIHLNRAANAIWKEVQTNTISPCPRILHALDVIGCRASSVSTKQVFKLCTALQHQRTNLGSKHVCFVFFVELLLIIEWYAFGHSRHRIRGVLEETTYSTE